MKTIPLFLWSLFFVLISPWSRAQSPGTGPPPASITISGKSAPVVVPEDEVIWPLTYTTNDVTVTIYQPQVEKWEGENFETRSVVSVRPANAREPVFGVFWMKALADVDKGSGEVTLNQFQVTRTSFPTAPEKEGDYLTLIRSMVSTAPQTVSLENIEANYALSTAVKKFQTFVVDNTPPRIIYSTTPALLVLVDGRPVLRPIPSITNVQQVINTRALLLHANDTYYLSAAGHWYDAQNVEGPWSISDRVPSAVESAKQAVSAAKNVDLMLPEPKDVTTRPALYVSTIPAELVQTDGTPNLVPVEGTQLMEVKNTDSDLFLNLADQEYYLLLSGRWFKSKTMEGPWVYAPYETLPKDLAQIPTDHPKANVLISVPGTPQAKAAVIANSIPQTATVNRTNTSLQANYDGTPDFQPIEGTPLAYAVNSPTPVIRVDPNTYYALENGVWFVSFSPFGPWTVASSVPAVIYTIPPSSPMHYVTYAQVYRATPEYVTVGYTPGYLGTVVNNDYVVVYGTGYRYQPYIGSSFWVGWPCTYGFGVGFSSGWYSSFGFNFGFGFGFSSGHFRGSACNPWWGPFGSSFRHGRRFTDVDLNRFNVFHNFDRSSFRHSHGFSSFDRDRARDWNRGGWDNRFNHFSPNSSRGGRGDRFGQWNGNRFQDRGERFGQWNGNRFQDRGGRTRTGFEGNRGFASGSVIRDPSGMQRRSDTLGTRGFQERGNAFARPAIQTPLGFGSLAVGRQRSATLEPRGLQERATIQTRAPVQQPLGLNGSIGGRRGGTPALQPQGTQDRPTIQTRAPIQQPLGISGTTGGRDPLGVQQRSRQLEQSARQGGTAVQAPIRPSNSAFGDRQGNPFRGNSQGLGPRAEFQPRIQASPNARSFGGNGMGRIQGEATFRSPSPSVGGAGRISGGAAPQIGGGGQAGGRVGPAASPGPSSRGGNFSDGDRSRGGGGGGGRGGGGGGGGRGGGGHSGHR